jgi:hypothetical protein
VLEEYQDAVKNTIAKRRNIERLKASSNIRPERVDDALEELEEANKIEQHIHRRVEGISQNLHHALHRHSRLAHEDLTAALIEHARMNILYEKQLLRELESLRPDVAHAADPAPPPESLPAAAAIAPLAALNRSATLPVSGNFQRAPTTSGHFMPPSAQPQARSLSQQGPGPIITPSSAGFIQPTQALGTPATPVSAASSNGAVQPAATINGPPSIPSFPRTTQFANQSGDSSSPVQTAPGFPKTSQFTGQVPPSAALTPGFPKTNQFVNPSPTTPIMTPGFPKTSMFTPNNPATATPSTPGFPKTSQFIGVASPLSAGTPGTSGFSSFPRTSQFLPGAQSQPQRPLSAASGSTSGPVDGQNRPNGANGMMSPGYQPLPSGPSTPIRSPLSQSQQFPSQRPTSPYHQPALPSQLQQQQQQQQPSQHNVDPLGGGSRFISNQPSPSAPPTLPHTPTRMAASISGLPSRTNSMTSPSPTNVDPLTGGGLRNGGGGAMSQSMFVSPTSASTQYGPLGSAGLETGPLGGTVRGRPSGNATPTRSRLDAREAASKLANFL